MSGKLLISLLIVIIFCVPTFAAKADSAGWITVNKTLQSLIYEEGGEIVSSQFTGSYTTTLIIKTESGLYKWIEKTNGMNAKVSSTECKRLLKPGEAQ